jgi:AI-2 transport protein TqsA
MFGRRRDRAEPLPGGPAEPSARPVPTGSPRAALILAGLGGATLAAIGIWAIRGFFAPFFLALVLTISVHPLRVRLERLGVPRGVATGSVIAAVFLLLAAFATALGVALSQFASLLPQFGPQIREIGDWISDGLTRLGFDPSQAQSIVAGIDPGRALGFVGGLLGGVGDLVFGLVVILTTLILLAIDASSFPTVLKQLVRSRPAMVESITVFAAGVRRYMVVTTVLGVGQGLFNWVALLVLQVPGALLWGILSFLCSFIPNVGYFIAIVPPLVFGYFVGGWQTVLIVVLVYGVINAVVQSLIQPRVVGDAVSLSQTLTFVSVLFWATVLGPIGAILGVPLTLLVRAVLVDANPDARWWRPVIGDLRQTKALMKHEDAASKAARHARSNGR